jgi:lipoprotein-anchoring transpeptidase ErfK/SrfK
VKTLLIAGAALLATAPAALAQQVPPTDPQQPAPPVTTPQQTPPAPTPEPAAGKGAIALTGGMTDKGKRYLAAGHKVSLTGRVKPFVAGQVVVVELFRGSKRVSRRVVPVTEARDGNGEFAVEFRASNAGVYTVKARHKATSEQARFTLASQRFEALGGDVGAGSGAKKVRLVQVALARLAFVTSTSGRWDDATARAVIAFRKTNRMSRTGDNTTKKGFEMLLNGEGGYKLKYPKAGKHVEADLSRQVLVLARDGKPERIYHTSSGAPATPTVVGSFSFYRKSPGTNAKGMVHSSYFIRGYAIHGYHSVPTYNASHGCLRVPIANARSIFDWINLGDRIYVYR